MAARAEKIIFMGYTKTTHNYIIYNPSTHNFYKQRDIIFDKKTPGILKTTPSLLNASLNKDYNPEQLQTI